MLFETYDPEQFYDEYFASPGCPRPNTEAVVQWLQTFSRDDLIQANTTVEKTLEGLGATFTFDGNPRVLPFDVIPRVMIQKDPRVFLAQPTIYLSRILTIVNGVFNWVMLAVE